MRDHGAILGEEADLRGARAPSGCAANERATLTRSPTPGQHT